MRITRLVDLSVPVGPRTVVYPGDPTPRFTVHSTVERDGFNLLDLHLGSQSGTHVDAPYPFEDDAPRPARPSRRPPLLTIGGPAPRAAAGAPPPPSGGRGGSGPPRPPGNVAG